MNLEVFVQIKHFPTKSLRAEKIVNSVIRGKQLLQLPKNVDHSLIFSFINLKTSFSLWAIANHLTTFPSGN